MSHNPERDSFYGGHLMREVDELNKAGKKQAIKTWSYRLTTFPQFMEHTLAVHNGKKHPPVYVTGDMIECKFGGSVLTRKYGGHGNNNERAEQ